MISLQLRGIVGLFAGVLGGIFFANRGFSLGKSKEQSQSSGLIGPIFAVILLVLALTQFKFGENLAIYTSEKGLVHNMRLFGCHLLADYFSVC